MPYTPSDGISIFNMNALFEQALNALIPCKMSGFLKNEIKLKKSCKIFVFCHDALWLMKLTDLFYK